jgi:hypothetical protein
MRLSSLSPLLAVLPHSNVTVDIKVFNSFPTVLQTNLGIPAADFYFPVINPGANLFLDIYAFYIEHPVASSKKMGGNRNVERYMFDLGIRKDLQNLAPVIASNVTLPSDIPTQLVEGGIALDSIKAVFWRWVFYLFIGNGLEFAYLFLRYSSHTHADHIGDMSLFPNSTQLIVGEDSDLRTFPTFANASLTESDFA